MRVVFACAGTGGHINPAIAMANLIIKKEKDSKVIFIGTETGLENKLVKNAGYEIKHIRTGKILRELTLKNVTALINAYKGISDAKRILEEFKPDLVIGTGGYICGPVMKAAKKLKIPYMLHESNAFPGVAVKLLAKDAKCVMVGFDDARERLHKKANVIYTGTPAKFGEEDIFRLNKEQCLEKLNLNNINKRIILVTCGSQGAKRVNEVVLSMIKKYQDKNVYYILVTGDKNYDEVLKLKEEAEKEIGHSLDEFLRLEKFIFNMDEMYKVADLCITRAGAMTISELALSHNPSILIPLPTAAENHQFFNAKVLEQVDAARIIEQKDLTEQKLNDAVLEIIADNENINRMGENAAKVIVKNVEEKIYECIKMK
ncbi:MAG: undecaprenyldiphospho-muramoylpentapeptide beta-N-acetylglucosaminyltransferase [Clostridia bacterium]|nr:undecaprenyldiphospho-muramoylpentapeptide beta-N-acetylglucosaminyltransferase [Clostridia bacterium]